jgi:phospholipase C
MHNHLTRRSFLAGLSVAAPLALTAQPTKVLPKPHKSGIKHVIVVMMENRSFDHFLGWLPGADGKQAGLTFKNTAGQPQTTARLNDFQNCSLADPDHSYAGGRVQLNSGQCDGWLASNTKDNFSIGYYTQADLAFFGSAAPEWTVCDRYFCGILGPTFPNRFYQHSAQTDRLSNTVVLSTMPTIWDNLAAAGLDGRYYFNDSAFLALWGPKYTSITSPYSQFLADCAAGNLAHVTYIDPKFINEGTGTSTDDHPHADVRNGEVFLNEIYNAVTTGPQWPHTILVINYDEWGGFFDHVPPPAGPIPAADVAAGNQDGLLGFRVPNLIVSPWSRRGFVDHTQYDHTSILRMIEWRWQLPPLSLRDASANNLALALDFSQPNLSAPVYAVPAGPFSGVCGTPALNPIGPFGQGQDDEDREWVPVRDLGRQFGFPA